MEWCRVGSAGLTPLNDIHILEYEKNQLSGLIHRKNLRILFLSFHYAVSSS